MKQVRYVCDFCEAIEGPFSMAAGAADVRSEHRQVATMLLCQKCQARAIDLLIADRDGPHIEIDTTALIAGAKRRTDAMAAARSGPRLLDGLHAAPERIEPASSSASSADSSSVHGRPRRSNGPRGDRALPIELQRRSAPCARSSPPASARNACALRPARGASRLHCEEQRRVQQPLHRCTEADSVGSQRDSRESSNR